MDREVSSGIDSLLKDWVKGSRCERSVSLRSSIPLTFGVIQDLGANHKMCCALFLCVEKLVESWRSGLRSVVEGDSKDPLWRVHDVGIVTCFVSEVSSTSASLQHPRVPVP